MELDSMVQAKEDVTTEEKKSIRVHNRRNLTYLKWERIMFGFGLQPIEPIDRIIVVGISISIERKKYACS